GSAMNGFVLALGAETTAGYYAGERPEGLSPAAPYPDDLPEVLRNLGLVELLGPSGSSHDLEFPLTDADRAEARGLLPPAGIRTRPRVGIHPGASAPSRRWPADRFAAVASWLVEQLG